MGDISSRGISGGERKRLSLACELVGNPSLLIVDEPSSGLDSFQSQNVIYLLRQLARSNDMAVVMSIHQPSSSMWTMIDDLLVLCPKGKPIYHGPRENILPYLESLGYPCPAQTNPAEFILDLVSVDTTSEATQHVSLQRIDGLIRAYESSHHPPLMLPASSGPRPVAQMSHFRRFLIHPVKRVLLLFQRAFRQTTRDHATNIVRVGTSILLAIVVSAVHGKQGYHEETLLSTNFIDLISRSNYGSRFSP